MAQRDILIRIGGSVLDTQFTQSVSTIKVECAECADFAPAAVLVAIGNPEINKFEVIRGADYYRLRKSKIANRRRGCSSMAERQLPKLHTGVRFPSPALFH
jgi:hypothetical protein